MDTCKEKKGLYLNQYYHSLKSGLMIPKQIKLRNEKHLKWIRKRPCIVTGQEGVDAHHIQRKSQGLNDYTAVPLNHELHVGKLHSELGWEKFEQEYNIDFKDALIATLIERIVELEENT